jgi:hypothetical protein
VEGVNLESLVEYQNGQLVSLTIVKLSNVPHALAAKERFKIMMTFIK